MSPRRVLILILAVLFVGMAPLSAAVAKDSNGGTILIARDAAGNITSRTVVNRDGTQHQTRSKYGPGNRTASRTVDDDRDRDGRTTSRIVTMFDIGRQEPSRVPPSPSLPKCGPTRFALRSARDQPARQNEGQREAKTISFPSQVMPCKPAGVHDLSPGTGTGRTFLQAQLREPLATLAKRLDAPRPHSRLDRSRVRRRA
jgi:hypothetical protein